MFPKFYLLILSIVVITFAQNINKRHYYIDLELLKVDIKVDYISHDLELRRARRIDSPNVNGTITLGQDLGPNCTFEAALYRSPRGNDDFKPLPFKINQNFGNLFGTNGFYSTTLKKDLCICSNVPNYIDETKGVLKAGKYNFEMCDFKLEGFPDDLLNGFYKMIANITDGNNLISQVEVVAEVVIIS